MTAVMYLSQYQQGVTTPQEQQPLPSTSITPTVIEHKAALQPIWKFLAVLPSNALLIGYIKPPYLEDCCVVSRLIRR